MKNTLKERKTVVLEFMRSEFYVPMKEKELAVMLQVKPEDRAAFKETLASLLHDGSIMVTKRGRYQVMAQQVIVGTFLGTQKGFGFVEVEGENEDYFIPAESSMGAFHLDRVEIVKTADAHGEHHKTGKVIRIIGHGLSTLVGTYQASRHYGFVVPDVQKIGSDIFIPDGASMGATDEQKVVVQITDYGQNRRNPEGKIIEILGSIQEDVVDILSVIRAHSLPEKFPVKVLQQAERLAVPVSEADCLGRMDLRNVQMVTIDGEDAKDLDDAVSLTVENGLYHLGVHIADVTNYVQENSALDREALKRGTSVYLADRVIPMLPPELSNGICSLNEGEDRLALSCLMTIDNSGSVIDHRLTESVIRVNRRMTYTAVNQILTDENGPEAEKYCDLVYMFQSMDRLAKILRGKRRRRGSIDFDFPETKLVLNEHGRPVDILPYERNDATRLIEDFMLIANETVAEHVYWQDIPFVYRIHEHPDQDSIRKLVTFIRNYGFSVKVGSKEEIHPKEIQKLLDSISGTEEEAMLSRLTLRSLKRARYSTVSTGHFGLACDYYCHFTSPIRRYPDLQIHRIIKDELRGRLNEQRIEHYRAILDGVARQSSEMERRADDAERETVKLKKAQYMENRIGLSYDGVISGVAAWGMYVELLNTVEGMVHISKIPGDYYIYDEKSCALYGKTTGRTYRLGQAVRVKAEAVDLLSGNIDFSVAND
ncbi:MAG: ribonuclease R [Lachnospiraceae bacterium]|nr:ribonuclease R [Lachnospiraceae bacterium]